MRRGWAGWSGMRAKHVLKLGTGWAAGRELDRTTSPDSTKHRARQITELYR